MTELRSICRAAIHVFLILGLLAGCAGPQIKTGIGVAPGADFSRRVTFQFLPDAGPHTAPNSGYYHDLIGRDILAALNSQRYRYFTNRKTDLLVSYRYFSMADEAVKNWTSYSGYKFAAGVGAQAELKRSKPTAAAGGVIVIDVIDPKPRRLIWRGWATLSAAYLNDRAAQERLIKDAVNKTLKELPARRSH